MAIPMRAGTPQFFRDDGMVSADHVGGLPEKPPHYVPHACTGKARYAITACPCKDGGSGGLRTEQLAGAFRGWHREA